LRKFFVDNPAHILSDTFLATLERFLDIEDLDDDDEIEDAEDNSMEPDWPLLFLRYNSILEVSDRWSVCPTYSKSPFICIPESSLALLLFENPDRLLLRNEKHPNFLTIPERTSAFRVLNVLRPNYLNQQTISEPGRFIKDFICDLGGYKNRQIRLKTQGPNSVLRLPKAIQTNGYSLKMIFRVRGVIKIKYNEMKSKLKPYDICHLIDKTTYSPEFSKQNKRDIAQYLHLQYIKEVVNITFTGLDSGERYPLGFASIRSDTDLAFGKVSRDACYNICDLPLRNKMKETKPEFIKQYELACSRDPTNRLLNYNSYIASLDFYKSDTLRGLKQNSEKMRRAWYQQCLDMILKCAGADSNTKAEEWMIEEKAFVFVFEIGSDFGSSATGKKGNRSPMHVGLQNFVVRGVTIY
jgi:hypothetical protein